MSPILANLSQYQAKTKEELPIIVTILDAYDSLSQTDNRKDGIDNLLVKLLREGAALGMYLVFSAGRYNAIRMNMMANIQTKLALFLNDDGDLGNLFGREKLAQVEIPGRAQIKLEEPLALQIYLPVKGDSEVDILIALEQEITAMIDSWSGNLPEAIPMVPDELDTKTFDNYISKTSDHVLYLGLNKASSEPETFELFKGRTLGIFPETVKQAKVIYPFLTEQLLNQVSNEKIIVIDTNNGLDFLRSNVSLYVGKKMIKAEPQLVKDALEDLIEKDASMQQLVIINGVSDIFEKLSITPDLVLDIIGLQNINVQLIFMDNMSRIANSYSITGPLKENTYQLLFGGDLNTQRFIDNLSMDVKKEVHAKNVLHVIKDEELFNIVVPTEKEGE